MIGRVAQADLHEDLRVGVRALCREYPDSYWRELDARRAYPDAFVKALTGAGYLSALIPEEYGGSGLGITEASIIMEEINRSGANAGACHAQMYIMGTLLRHGSDAQKRRYLLKIASGELRLQAFGVTEPSTGSDTTRLNEVRRRTDGLSVFLIDLRESLGRGVEIRPIAAMINHNTTEVFFDNLKVSPDALIGEEGRGFRYILDGMNAERILVAQECIGDGRWLLRKGIDYAKERVVFDRPIGQNQGVQFPLARAYAELEAADMICRRAAALFDAGEECGADANMAKLLASEAGWHAAEATMTTYGGFAFAREYDIERKWREIRLYQTAPISTNLILAYIGQHVLGMPRSY